MLTVNRAFREQINPQPKRKLFPYAGAACHAVLSALEWIYSLIFKSTIPRPKQARPVYSYVKSNRLWRPLCILAFIALPTLAEAEADWGSFTIDNDLFVNSDDGYTNGFYYSWYDTGSNKKPAIGFLASIMSWSLPDARPQATYSAKTIGQTMATPEDISVAEPPPGDLPYTGLLDFTDSYITLRDVYADSVTATIGVVGPTSGAEATQRFIHQISASDEPEGWDTQLNNELVFQVSRAHARQSWLSDSENTDVLLGVNAALGTIQSLVEASILLRYGIQLKRTFATSLLATTRTANPVAIENGWYVFVGTSARYVFNQIFTDGNTFRDSRSIDYDKEQIAVTAGIAYSWDNLSITFAINDFNIIANESREEIEEFTRYGTLTVAWRN